MAGAMTSAQGLFVKLASGYHFSRDHSYYLDEFEGLSVIIFAGGQNDNVSKDGFCDKSGALRF